MPTVHARIERVEPPNQNGYAKIYATIDGVEKDLSTSHEQKIAEALRLRGQWVELTYDENPVTKFNEKLGRNVTYPNRYYEGATVSGTQGAQSAGLNYDSPPGAAGAGNGPLDGFDPAPPQSEYGRKTNPADAWRMALSTGAKLAIETLPMLPGEQRGFKFQKEVALAWARFIFFTAPPTAQDIAHEVEQSLFPDYQHEFTGAATGAAYDAPPPRGDDDIPF